MSMCSKQKTPTMKSQKGLTIVEILITVSIIAITTAIAVPAFYGYQDSVNRVMVSSALVDDLSLARKEALNRRATVSIVFDADSSWQVQTLDVNNPPNVLILKDFYNSYDTKIKVNGALAQTVAYTNRGYTQQQYDFTVDYGDSQVSTYTITRSGRLTYEK